MYLNINNTRIKLKGVLAYGPFYKPNTDTQKEEFGICVYYNNKDVEIHIPRTEIDNVLKMIDDIISK